MVYIPPNLLIGVVMRQIITLLCCFAVFLIWNLTLQFQVIYLLKGQKKSVVLINDLSSATKGLADSLSDLTKAFYADKEVRAMEEFRERHPELKGN